MIVSDKEDLRAGHDGIEEMVPVTEFGGKLGGTVDRRVYFPTEPSLRPRQGPGEACDGCVADYHQVDVACRVLLAPGERAEQERYSDLARDCSQCHLQDVRHADGFNVSPRPNASDISLLAQA
jgi:hypothetical protein